MPIIRVLTVTAHLFRVIPFSTPTAVVAQVHVTPASFWWEAPALPAIAIAQNASAQAKIVPLACLLQLSTT